MKKLGFVGMCGLLIFIMCNSVYAGWSSSEETIISGTWGEGTSQFGLKSGDTIAYDQYPEFHGVDENEIIVHDSVNRRYAVYDINGANVRHEQEKRTFLPGGGYTVERPNEKLTGWIEEDGKYVLYNSLGEPTTTSSTRPLELGKLKINKISSSQYKYELEYPEAIYVYEGNKDMLSEKEILRINTNLIMQNFKDRVYAYKVTAEIPVQPNEKKKYKIDKVFEWTRPKGSSSGAEPITKPDGTILAYKRPTTYNIYGEAVIGPDGSIYTWMRSETNYKILRWKWVE